MNDIKKKIANIWYYYKIPIIVVIAVLYLAIYSFVNYKPYKEKDHSIAIISENNYPSETQVNSIINAFEKKYEGSFEVVIYNIDIDGYGQDETIISRLDLDLRNKISEYYFIDDLDGFNYATNNLQFASVEKVENIPWLQGVGVDDFYYCVR